MKKPFLLFLKVLVWLGTQKKPSECSVDIDKSRVSDQNGICRLYSL